MRILSQFSRLYIHTGHLIFKLHLTCVLDSQQQLYALFRTFVTYFTKCCVSMTFSYTDMSITIDRKELL